MNKLMTWAWVAVLATSSVMAQDEAVPADAAPPADTTVETAPADAAATEAVAEAPPADAAPVEEAVAPAEEPAPTEDTASAEDSGDSSGSDEGGGDGEGLKLYVGVDYDMTTVDINDGEVETALSGDRFDSDFYKLRLGTRLFEAVGLELNAGFPANNASSEKLETKQFYALYLVPTGVLFELIEVSARIGYAYTELKGDAGSEDADGMSFGLGVELPLRRFGESLPDLRLGVGGTVYQEDRDGRVYGFHGGVRYDFML